MKAKAALGVSLAAFVALRAPCGAAAAPRAATLPQRVTRVVLHTPGGPDYDKPERRFRFLSPRQTQALWSSRFGAQWILWTDGSLWPRHPRDAGHPSWLPDVSRAASAVDQRRIAAEAAPVYGHVAGYNADSVGIEVAHSGRSDEPFPDVQVRALAWLLRTMFAMSEGRLGPERVMGHKDLDARPAYVDDSCDTNPCPYYVDESGEAYRRRVDPPESLFVALARSGVNVPRPAGKAADRDLLRAEAMPRGSVPRTHQ